MFQKAGIGTGRQNTSVGPPIRAGDAHHRSPSPRCSHPHETLFLKVACETEPQFVLPQYGIMKPEDLPLLKNNKGTEDNRVPHMDYGVSPKLSHERLIAGGDITLLPPRCTLIYDAFR